MRRQVVATVAAVGLLAAALSSPVVAQPQEPTPTLAVDLEDDGSAEVTLRLTYDLGSDSERTAFRDLQDSESQREAVVSRFRERMNRVASAMANETGRETSVSDASIDLSTANDGTTGLVDLSAEFEGFAAATDGRVTVTQPFAGDYDPDRRLVVTGPEGYEPTAVTPEPSSTDGARLEWSSDADLSGFEVTYTDPDGAASATESDADGESDGASTEAGDDSGSGGQAPGFGVVGALVALVAVGLFARRGGR